MGKIDADSDAIKIETVADQHKTSGGVGGGDNPTEAEGRIERAAKTRI
jgi:hypothetical protein